MRVICADFSATSANWKLSNVLSRSADQARPSRAMNRVQPNRPVTREPDFAPPPRPVTGERAQILSAANTLIAWVRIAPRQSAHRSTSNTASRIIVESSLRQSWLRHATCARFAVHPGLPAVGPPRHLARQMADEFNELVTLVIGDVWSLDSSVSGGPCVGLAHFPDGARTGRTVSGSSDVDDRPVRSSARRLRDSR